MGRDYGCSGGEVVDRGGGTKWEEEVALTPQIFKHLNIFFIKKFLSTHFGCNTTFGGQCNVLLPRPIFALSWLVTDLENISDISK